MISRNEVCHSKVFELWRGRDIGHITGIARFRAYYTLWTDSKSNNLQVRFTLKNESWTGDIGGVAFYLAATPSCQNCTVKKDHPINGSKLTQNGVWYGAREFTGNIPGYGKAQNVMAGYSWKVTGSGLTANADSFQSRTTRCDNGLYGHGIRNPIGCVITNVTPEHTVTATGRQKYYDHLKNARTSGLRGFSPSSTLTYSRDTALVNRNYATSCKTITSLYPRPAGDYQCDEFPFKSTREGAASNPTPRSFPGCAMGDPQRTGANGFSRCYIPSHDNLSGGGILSFFYSDNRLADGEKFYISLR